MCVADINECEEQMSPCPQNLVCINLPGSFICSGWLRLFHSTCCMCLICGTNLFMRVAFKHGSCAFMCVPCYPEAPSLSAASVASAVILVVGGVAALLLLTFCYRRSVRLFQTNSWNWLLSTPLATLTNMIVGITWSISRLDT